MALALDVELTLLRGLLYVGVVVLALLLLLLLASGLVLFSFLFRLVIDASDSRFDSRLGVRGAFCCFYCLLSRLCLLLLLA